MQNLFGYSRVLAIGDVHGMYEKLIKLMDKIRFNPDEDLLIFLGDYIARIRAGVCNIFLRCSSSIRMLWSA